MVEAMLSDLRNRVLVDAYRRACWPWLQVRLRSLRKAGRAPVIVLVYHRVADDEANPWTLRRADFEKQIRWLTRHYSMVSLEDTQALIRGGKNHSVKVSITFDDGYAANTEFAIPLLLSLRIPCTYFVTAHPIFTGSAFTHDAVRGYTAAPNTVTELRAMADSGVAIGCHSYTHADLGSRVTEDTIVQEVVQARVELEQALGQPVRYFAFPFGHPQHLSPAAFRLARVSGYDAACSAYGGYNYPGDDAFHLQRIPVDYMSRLKNWLSMHPRYRHRVSRYQWQ